MGDNMVKPLSDKGLDKIFNYLTRQTEENVRVYKQRSSPYVDLTYMHLLCAANAVKNVVEIGTFRGLSACFMALGVSGSVHTINRNAAEITSANKLAEDLEIENIVFYEGDSLEVLPSLVTRLDGDFQLGYIDGWHSYEYAMSEYQLLDKSIDKACGLIAFDDAAKVHPDGKDDGGVPRVLEQLSITPSPIVRKRIAFKTYGDFRTLETPAR